MSWNYRVIRTNDGEEDYFAIHECFYDKHGNPDATTVEAITVGGGSIEELRETLQLMLNCLDKPSLTVIDEPFEIKEDPQ